MQEIRIASKPLISLTLRSYRVHIANLMLLKVSFPNQKECLNIDVEIMELQELIRHAEQILKNME
jgi:alpha-acetolactate decarboxylase